MIGDTQFEFSRASIEIGTGPRVLVSDVVEKAEEKIASLNNLQERFAFDSLKFPYAYLLTEMIRTYLLEPLFIWKD